MKQKAGRPAKYKTAAELQKRIDAYFEEQCAPSDIDGLPGEIPNVLGLVAFLGFADRCSLGEYEKRDEFTHTIKATKTRIYNEKMQLAMRGVVNPTIFIFDAVNNHGMVNTRSENKNDNKHNIGKDFPIPVTVTYVDAPPREET